MRYGGSGVSRGSFFASAQSFSVQDPARGPGIWHS